MKFICSLFFFLSTSICFAQPASPADTNPLDSVFRIQYPKVYAQIGQPYLPFGFKVGDKVITNNSLAGKVVLINFWFEACEPCMAEMNGLNHLFDSLKDKETFQFISLTRDNEDAVKRVRKRFKVDFPVICTTDIECRRLNFGSGYPASIVLDKTGTIRYIHVGGYSRQKDATQHVMTTILPEIQSLL